MIVFVEGSVIAALLSEWNRQLCAKEKCSLQKEKGLCNGLVVRAWDRRKETCRSRTLTMNSNVLVVGIWSGR